MNMKLARQLAKRILPAGVAAQLRDTRDGRRVRAALRATSSTVGRRSLKSEVVLKALELTGASALMQTEDSQTLADVRCWAHGSDRMSVGLG